jgi:hypothetical protein
MSNRRWVTLVKTAALWLAVLTVTGPLSLAQLSTTGTITGTVRDASGAVVPGASIVIVNAGTRVQRKTLSNSDGSFVVPGLTIGTYGVAATKQGFQTVLLSL